MLSTEAARPADDPVLERAYRLLRVCDRTEAALRDRLVAGGAGEADVDRVLARLRALGLVDDALFAERWVEGAVRRRGLGADALAAGLVAKGVPEDVARAAIAAAAPDEPGRARALAASLARRVARFPPAHQGARLVAMLSRRGFSADVAEDAVRAVLPPEGWD